MFYRHKYHAFNVVSLVRSQMKLYYSENEYASMFNLVKLSIYDSFWCNSEQEKYLLISPPYYLRCDRYDWLQKHYLLSSKQLYGTMLNQGFICQVLLETLNDLKQ